MQDINPNSEDSSAMSVNRVKFKTIQKSFETIGFKSQEIGSVYSILAGILNTGNVTFVEREKKHQTLCAVENLDLLKIVAELYGVDTKELSEALICSGMVARGETIVRNHSIEEAVNVRDAMSKAMYGRLFSWLVNKTNALLKPASAKDSDVENFAIGILDIFGFENFETNSFEQLCINIANEQIQYYFNQHIFAWELQEYTNEGIDATVVEFVDNRPVLDMFLVKPIGLLTLLDEESNFPKGTDASLVDKFKQNVRSPHLTFPKSQQLGFVIDHYAGKVEYDATGFLEKNRDRLAGEVISVLRMSQIALVRTLFHSPITKTGNLAYNSLGSTYSSTINSPTGSVGSLISVRSASNAPTTSSQSRNQQTVASYFRYSLMDLLSKMVGGTPHFVRCIRPNIENSPGYFDQEKVQLQLRYTGVLETTRIRRQGYSHRIPFSEFLKRYYILGFTFNEKVRVNRESCQILLQKVGLTNWAMGKTKVFLKYYHIEQLSRLYEQQHRAIIRAQAAVRMWLQRRRYRQLLEKRTESATLLQKYAKGFLVRKRYRPVLEKRRLGIIHLQALVRGFLQRRRYAKLKREAHIKAVLVQSIVRGFLSRQRVRRLRMANEDKYFHAAIILQKNFRMWKAQSLYVGMQLKQTKSNAQAVSFMQQVETYGDDMYNNQKQAIEKDDDSSNSLSDERIHQLQRTNDIKTPWTPQDSSYYDSLSDENQRKTSSWSKMRKDGVLRKANDEESNTDVIIMPNVSGDQAIVPLWNSSMAETSSKETINGSTESEDLSHKKIVQMFEETIRAEEEKLEATESLSQNIKKDVTADYSKPKNGLNVHNDIVKNPGIRTPQNGRIAKLINCLDSQANLSDKSKTYEEISDDISKCNTLPLKDDTTRKSMTSLSTAGDINHNVIESKALPKAIQNYIKGNGIKSNNSLNVYNHHKPSENQNKENTGMKSNSDLSRKLTEDKKQKEKVSDRKPLIVCQSFLGPKPFNSSMSHQSSRLKSASLPCLIDDQHRVPNKHAKVPNAALKNGLRSHHVSHTNISAIEKPQRPGSRSHSQMHSQLPPSSNRPGSSFSNRLQVPSRCSHRSPDRLQSPVRNGSPVRIHSRSQDRLQSPHRHSHSPARVGSHHPPQLQPTSRPTSNMSKASAKYLDRLQSPTRNGDDPAQANSRSSQRLPSPPRENQSRLQSPTRSITDAPPRPPSRTSNHIQSRLQSRSEVLTPTSRAGSQSSLRKDTEDLFYYSQLGKVVMKETETGTPLFYCEDEIYDQVGNPSKESNVRRPLSRQKILAQKQVADAIKSNGFKLVADDQSLTSDYLDRYGFAFPGSVDSIECTSRESHIDGQKRKVQGFSYTPDQSSLERAINNRKNSMTESTPAFSTRQTLLNRINKFTNDPSAQRIESSPPRTNGFHKPSNGRSHLMSHSTSDIPMTTLMPSLVVKYFQKHQSPPEKQYSIQPDSRSNTEVGENGKNGESHENQQEMADSSQRQDDGHHDDQTPNQSGNHSQTIESSKNTASLWNAIRDQIKTENSASIRITNCIEDDQTTYKEEFIQEQTNLREELIKSLELQKRNSVAARFARRQETERKQEELEARWREVQEIKEADDGIYRRILSRESSVADHMNNNSHSRQDTLDKVDNDNRHDDLNRHDKKNSFYGDDDDDLNRYDKKNSFYDDDDLSHHDKKNSFYDDDDDDDEITDTYKQDYRHDNTHEGDTDNRDIPKRLTIPDSTEDDGPGRFDYRAVLKRRSGEGNISPPPKSTNTDTQPTFDYRSVLKKRGIDPESAKTSKQVVFEAPKTKM